MDLLTRASKRSAAALIALSLLAAAPVGCAPSHPDTRPIAQCCVCKCNGDLGCLIVHIDDKTPRSSYKDRVYYFCSEDCKTAFDKAPENYLKR